VHRRDRVSAPEASPSDAAPTVVVAAMGNISCGQDSSMPLP
jgi:hypothetical protein